MSERITSHERPGVYSRYEASSVVRGGAGKTVALLAKAAEGDGTKATLWHTYTQAAEDLGSSTETAELVRLLFRNGASAVYGIPVSQDGQYTQAIATAEQLEQLETLANRIVAENRPITAEYPDPEVLKTLDYRSKLDLTENVRIVTVEHCDVCACCAPHVSRTGEIGVIKLLDAMRHRGGIRIWMAAGSMALEDYRVKQKNVAAISAALSVKQPEAAQGVERLLKERDALALALKEARQALTLQKLQTLPETDGNLVLFEDDLDANSLRALANGGMEKCAGICAVFTGSDKTGYRYVMGSKTVDLRAQAKQINTALQGKGGGQPTMIQGSLSADRAAIEAYFA